MRKGRSVRRTVVKGAGQRKQVLLERVEGPRIGSTSSDLKQHLHQLFHRYYEQNHGEDTDNENTWLLLEPKLKVTLKSYALARCNPRVCQCTSKLPWSSRIVLGEHFFCFKFEILLCVLCDQREPFFVVVSQFNSMLVNVSMIEDHIPRNILLTHSSYTVTSRPLILKILPTEYFYHSVQYMLGLCISSHCRRLSTPLAFISNLVVNISCRLLLIFIDAAASVFCAGYM